MADTLEANTVKTYATVGVVFYGVAILLELLGIVTAIYGISRPWNRTPDASIALMWLGVPVLLSIVFAVWAYSTYKKIDEGSYIEARASALIVGIFGLGLGGFLGGLFFLLAYWKLGDLLRYTQMPVQKSVQAPTQTLSSPVNSKSTYTRACVNCGRMADVNSHFCAYCGSKLPE